MGIDPSGEQFVISGGDWSAAVVEVGGGLRTLRAGNLEILDGYQADEVCHDGRGQVLVPWPNRLADGSYQFEGRTCQVPLTEPARYNAIHGLTRWLPWSCRERQSDGVTMSCRLFPSPGYPFCLDLLAGYALSARGLTVTLEATNVGDEPCPFGAGQHPYLTCGTSLVDDARLRVPAQSMYRYDEKMIPVGKIPVGGSALDYREARPIGSTQIDMDFTDLMREGGIATVTLSSPETGASVSVWMDQSFKHITVYTGDTVQPPERRRQSVAIEPMTCPPNAFNSREDLLVLHPGEGWRGQWGISAS